MRRVIELVRLPADAGRFVCVDVESGAYEVNDDDLTAVNRLLARVPGADTYLARIGDEVTFTMMRL